MGKGLRIAFAVGAGYLLGRRRKTRLALLLGAAAATGQLGKAPAALGRAGARALAGAGGLEPIMEPGVRLVTAAKDAAAVAVTSRVESLTDRLRDRAQGLGVPDLGAGERGGEAPRRQPGQEDEDQYDEEPDEDDELDDDRYDDEEDDEPDPRQRDENGPAEPADEPRRVTRRRSTERDAGGGAPVRRRRS